MTGATLIGSCSWTDKTLIACGRFYPPAAKTAEARLRHYATQFPIVEVDSSYYGLPTPRNSELWAERTPPGFVFNVKAFRLFTGHAASPDVLPQDIRSALGPHAKRSLHEGELPPEIRDELWRRFAEALAPLRAAGKLGLVHFQFSPGVMRNREGIAWVEQCAARLPGHVLSAEFRHRSWFDGARAEETLALQQRLGLVHTIVDGPQGFVNSVPMVWAATHPGVALVRLHGRNSATWNDSRGPTSASRFDYWYQPDELAALVPEVQHLATQVKTVHVLFNTNNEDQGQVNARLMRELLRPVNRA